MAREGVVGSTMTGSEATAVAVHEDGLDLLRLGEHLAEDVGGVVLRLGLAGGAEVKVEAVLAVEAGLGQRDLGLAAVAGDAGGVLLDELAQLGLGGLGSGVLEARGELGELGRELVGAGLHLGDAGGELLAHLVDALVGLSLARALRPAADAGLAAREHDAGLAERGDLGLDALSIAGDGGGGLLLGARGERKRGGGGDQRQAEDLARAGDGLLEGGVIVDGDQVSIGVGEDDAEEIRFGQGEAARGDAHDFGKGRGFKMKATDVPVEFKLANNTISRRSNRHFD